MHACVYIIDTLIFIITGRTIYVRVCVCRERAPVAVGMKGRRVLTLRCDLIIDLPLASAVSS